MMKSVCAVIALLFLCAVEGCISGMARGRLAIDVAPGRQLYVNGIKVDQQWNVDTAPSACELAISVREPSAVSVAEFLEGLWNAGIGASLGPMIELPSGEYAQFVPSVRLPPDWSIPDIYVSDSCVQFLTHGGGEVATVPIMSMREQSLVFARTMKARGGEMEMQVTFRRTMNMAKVLAVLQMAKDAGFERFYLACTFGVPDDDAMLTNASIDAVRGLGGMEKIRILHQSPQVDDWTKN